ncbi:MAG TPA: hypothetical protein VIY30_03445, partial [Burkholderiaceae bacterium]
QGVRVLAPRRTTGALTAGRLDAAKEVGQRNREPILAGTALVVGGLWWVGRLGEGRALDGNAVPAGAASD